MPVGRARTIGVPFCALLSALGAFFSGGLEQACFQAAAAEIPPLLQEIVLHGGVKTPFQVSKEWLQIHNKTP